VNASSSPDPKSAVRDFWQAAACGERLYLESAAREHYARQAEIRYRLEPYIPGFAEFARWRGLRVLEIGVGLGADHQCFAEAGAELYGLDLTERAVGHVRHRMAQLGLPSRLLMGDAERLPFADDTFDLVYAWGVLHHSPDTPRAFAEVRRVLKPGGSARVMIYHKWSLVGLMLWLRYGLLAGRPWRSLEDIYARHLESPGTKAYGLGEVPALVQGFASHRAWTVLTHGDLLESEAGQRHRGLALTLARACWPRALIRRFLSRRGLFLLISAEK
jgi:SAM-dependent methyltransferase